MCPRLSANYVSCCPPNMAQVSVWAGNLQPVNDCIKIIFHFFFPPYNAAVFSTFFFPPNKLNWMESKVTITIQDG